MVIVVKQPSAARFGPKDALRVYAEVSVFFWMILHVWKTQFFSKYTYIWYFHITLFTTLECTKNADCRAGLYCDSGHCRGKFLSWYLYCNKIKNRMILICNISIIAMQIYFLFFRLEHISWRCVHYLKFVLLGLRVWFWIHYS